MKKSRLHRPIMVFPRGLLWWLLSLVAVAPALACMNEYRSNSGPKLDEKAVERSTYLVARLTQHPTRKPWDQRRDRLREQLAAGGDFRVKNDLATALAHTGEAAEAVKLLQEIEAEKPGLYFTAANLGTAYELAGDDRRALEWIRTGIERNPEAHDGTEWLHVRILEAKLALAQDPKWLESHSILFDGRSGRSGPAGNRGEKLTGPQVKTALLYQLHERLQFVLPPDQVVGVLLLELGELAGQEAEGLGAAAGILELATGYLKTPDGRHPLLERAQSQSELARSAQLLEKPRPILNAVGVGFLGLALLSLGCCVVRSRIAASRRCN